MNIKNLITSIRIPNNQNPYLEASKGTNEEHTLIKVKFPSAEKCMWIKSKLDLYYDICDT